MPSPPRPPKSMTKKPTPMLITEFKSFDEDENKKLIEKKKISKQGRPTKMTPEILRALKQAFHIGCSDAEACAFADISGKTLYTYCSNNPDFLQQKENMKKVGILKAKKKVFDNISEDLETAKWYLERKCSAEFGNKITAKVTQTNLNIEMPDFEKILELKKVFENNE